MEKLILFLPLVAAFISGFFGKIIGNKLSQIITCLFVIISAILSISVFYEILFHEYTNNIIIAKWITSGELNVNWSINIDSVSGVMLVVVTLVSSLVHIYSVGYMLHDPHKTRFMAYLSLFTFCLLYTSPSPRDLSTSRMPSSA